MDVPPVDLKRETFPILFDMLSLSEDFYMGNEAVAELTLLGRQDLLVELTTSTGEKRYVKYKDFAVTVGVKCSGIDVKVTFKLDG